MNPFATARGDKSAMRPLAKLLWTLDLLHMSTPPVDEMLQKILYKLMYNVHTYFSVSNHWL